jgi:hypothetical protein
MFISIPDEALVVDTEHNTEHITTAKITNANSFFTSFHLSYLLPCTLNHITLTEITQKMHSPLVTQAAFMLQSFLCYLTL